MRSELFPVIGKASQLRRWLSFNFVGALGVLVQVSVLTRLTEWLGLNYLAATALAVEAAVVHNFLWHERWTWADPTSCDTRGTCRRLLQFQLANGAVSLGGNLILMRFFVGSLSLDYTVANVLAIGICSTANFLASDRLVFRLLIMEAREGMTAIDSRAVSTARRCPLRPKGVILAAILSLAAALSTSRGMEAAELRAETIKAWEAYIQATERRIGEEIRAQTGFLALDFQQASSAALERRAVLAGNIPVARMMTAGPNTSPIDVPRGMIHHWRGSIFIPGLVLQDVLARVVNPGAEDAKQADVLESRVLERRDDSLKLYFKLQRSKFVTVVYNTEHLVRYRKHGETHASSSSVATKIAELENPNSQREREKPEGEDRGFLWKLNSYWRYEQVAGGVVVECESVSLSRTVPAFMEAAVRPMIDSVARESLKRTLSSMRDRLVRGENRRQAPNSLASSGATALSRGRRRQPELWRVRSG